MCRWFVLKLAQKHENILMFGALPATPPQHSNERSSFESLNCFFRKFTKNTKFSVYSFYNIQYADKNHLLGLSFVIR